MLASRTSERQGSGAVPNGDVAPRQSMPRTSPPPAPLASAVAATPPPASGHDRSAEGVGRLRQHGRILSLDMLRGIAILLVLGRHTVAPVAGLGPFTPVVAAWTHIGWSGVDLFFVLSGFLVSGLIFAEFKRTGAVNIRRFVVRRGFKIWPPYLVYVGFVACWLEWKRLHGAVDGTVWHQLWPNLFHVQNYFHTPRVHTWSLAVEEHFYLAVALGFWWWFSRRAGATTRDAGMRSGWETPLDSRDHSPAAVPAVVAAPAPRRTAASLRAFPWLVTGLVALLAVVRTIAYRHAGADVNLYATHLRFDGLLIGTLLAYLTHFRPGVLVPLLRHPVALISVGVLFAAPVLCVPPETNAWAAGLGLTGMYVGYGLFLLGWLNLPTHTKWGRWLFGTRPAAWLGAIGFYSYSIYLWHVDLAQTPLHKLTLLAAAHGWSPGVVYAATTTVYVVVATICGALMARCLERPSIALRDRLFPSPIRAVAPGS